MKLTGTPWQNAWHDQDLAGKFIQDLQKLEQGPVKTLDSSALWMTHLLVELGQLAQNMIQLEADPPHPPQMLQAMERALKFGALAVHLAGALQQAHDLATAAVKESQPCDVGTLAKPGLAAAVESATLRAEASGMPPGHSVENPDKDAPIPMRRAIQSLADRGVALSELEVITGYPKHVIRAILAEP